MANGGGNGSGGGWHSGGMANGGNGNGGAWQGSGVAGGGNWNGGFHGGGAGNFHDSVAAFHGSGGGIWAHGMGLGTGGAAHAHFVHDHGQDHFGHGHGHDHPPGLANGAQPYNQNRLEFARDHLNEYLWRDNYFPYCRFYEPTDTVRLDDPDFGCVRIRKLHLSDAQLDAPPP